MKPFTEGGGTPTSISGPKGKGEKESRVEREREPGEELITTIINIALGVKNLLQYCPKWRSKCCSFLSAHVVPLRNYCIHPGTSWRNSNAFVALKTDGSVVAWGRNEWGGTAPRPSILLVVPLPP